MDYKEEKNYLSELLFQIMDSDSDSGFSSSFSTPVELLSQMPLWTSSPRSSLVDHFVEDKKNYLEKVASSIKASRDSFIKNCLEIDSAIEEKTNKIIEAVLKRKQELKMQLNEIQTSKLSEWDRQLKVCQNTFLWSYDINDVFSQMSELQEHYNKTFTSDIGFIDSGEVNFNVKDESKILNPLQKIGRLSYESKGVSAKFSFGKPGEKPGEFCRPWGVCADATGRILVADRCNHRVQIFHESGEFLLQFGKEGVNPGEFSRPTGITVDSNLRIIVSDKDNHRIQVFTYSGAFLFTFGRFGSGNGEFYYPWDVAVNSDCDIAVSDSKNHRVQLFDSKGTFIQKYNFRYSRVIGNPRGLVFYPNGNLIVTDFDNHRIFILNKTFTNIKTFGGAGSDPGKFSRPQGIAVDPRGRIAVSDCKNYRIQVFDSFGDICKIFGTKGTSEKELDCPQGICFHPNGSIIVVDFGNSRIQVF